LGLVVRAQYWIGTGKGPKEIGIKGKRYLFQEKGTAEKASVVTLFRECEYIQAWPIHQNVEQGSAPRMGDFDPHAGGVPTCYDQDLCV